MSNQFRIKENGFNEIKKKIILKTILIISIALLGGLTLVLYNANIRSSDLIFLLVIIPLLVGAMVFGLLIGIKRQRNVFESYLLIIEEDKILRRQNITPDITIFKNEIKQIIKVKEGAFAIKGNHSHDVIIVPPQVENIIDLEVKLSELCEITHRKNNPLKKGLSTIIGLITILLMVTVYISENKILVGSAGVTLTIGFIYSLIVTQKSKQLDRKTKGNIWLVLLVLLSIIVITYYKLMGNS